MRCGENEKMKSSFCRFMPSNIYTLIYVYMRFVENIYRQHKSKSSSKKQGLTTHQRDNDIKDALATLERILTE